MLSVLLKQAFCRPFSAVDNSNLSAAIYTHPVSTLQPSLTNYWLMRQLTPLAEAAHSAMQ